MSRRRIAAALVAAASVVAMSGCGTEKPGLPVEDDNAVELTAANFGTVFADAQASAKSMHATSDVLLPTGQKMAMEIDAAIGKGLDEFEMQVSADVGKQGSMEMRIVDSAMYMSGSIFPPTAKPWVRFDLDDPSNPMGAMFNQLLSLTDPERVEQMYAAIERLSDLGEETVDGVVTHHYTVTIDTADALKAVGLDKMKGVNLAKLLKSMPKTTSTQIWLDSEQRPVQTKSTVAGTETVIHYSDWGQPVSIHAPPAKQVRTIKF